MYHILVCDDDKEIVEAIRIYLSAEGYQVTSAYNGTEALAAIHAETPHLAILDIMMPELDGLHLTKKLREEGLTFPILFLSAKAEDTDKILGLNIGADDYITKPFRPLELVARVKSALRRYTTFGNLSDEEKEHCYTVGGLTINDDTKEVTVDGEPVRLTPTEYAMLLLLTQNRGRVFSTEQIYTAIWNEPSFGADNIVAVHIRHIREKIEINPREPRYLKVVWGLGYKIDWQD
ncbi:MAG: response regulator transcription factor [Lachnospiraceae bacterium]|nr:response regulator transcription factor [Lachnospiraceae bacterium]